MTCSIVSWNINSVRTRMELVKRFVETHRPDVLCLQEIKCSDDLFPREAFERMGYGHMAIAGQKAYHGVATLSRHPISVMESRAFCDTGHARHIAVRYDDAAPAELRCLTVHNFYVPAGGDEPDPEINPKFAHKLSYLTEMRSWSAALAKNSQDRQMMLGDLNVAPLETDVWSHKQLLKVVSHTPIEVDHLNAVQQAGNWVDAVRSFVPPEEKLFSWWSYRAQDWRASDRGRRLDHIWTSPAVRSSLADARVLKDVRGWNRPSDHAPVLVTLKAA